MLINQYDIVLVRPDPAIGAEIKKTRPCIVISPDPMNHFLHTVIVAPMTTSKKSYPTRIKIKLNHRVSYIIMDQIKTIDQKRILKKIGHLSRENAEACQVMIDAMFLPEEKN